MAALKTASRSLGWLQWPLILLGQLLLLLIALDFLLGLHDPLQPHRVLDTIQKTLVVNTQSAPAVLDATGQMVVPPIPYTPYYQSKLFWWVVLIVPVLSWILLLLRWGSRGPRAFEVRTSSGESILIHPGAIANFASARIEDHPAVSRHTIKVRQSGGKRIALVAQVRLAPNHSWVEASRQIEQSIRDGFAQVMGIEKIDKIELILGQDRKDMMVRPGPAGRAEAAPEAPVRGALDRPDPHSDVRADDDEGDLDSPPRP